MLNPINVATGPLRDKSAEEIDFLLRGFPERAIESAHVLREEYNIAEMQHCLLGLLKFYLPDGAETSEGKDTGKIRIREEDTTRHYKGQSL